MRGDIDSEASFVLSLDDTTRLVRICRVRSEIYAVLARGYLGDAGIDYMTSLKTILPVLISISHVTENEAFMSGVNDLNYLLSMAKNEAEFAESVSCQYATIFLVGHRDKTVNPCESVFLSDERLIMQEQRDQVMEFYARFGMGVAGGFTEPEDHISAELSFISSLSFQTAEALCRNDLSEAKSLLQSQIEFMDKHLLLWIAQLCRDIRQADGEGLYHYLADVTYGYVQNDYQSLCNLVDVFPSSSA